MIASGYSMDLYCDSAQAHAYGTGFAQFYAETFARCRKEAEKKGWLFDMPTRRVLCPQCRKAGRTLPPLPL